MASRDGSEGGPGAAPGGARPRGRSREVALAAASVLLVLLLAEAGARLWVLRTWSVGLVQALTQESRERGRFVFHPAYGYVLVPSWEGNRRTHNRHGYRGPAFDLRKAPGTLRVVVLGGSTVYGPAVRDEETSAQRLEARLGEALAPRPVEVINAGVPGWTSRETRMQLEDRVLALGPDAVVVLDGRNEIFPQVWNGYRDDYEHFRAVGPERRRLQAGWKRLFRVSHLALLVAGREPGHLGFSTLLENPVYATIRWEGRPDAEAIRRHAGEARRLAGYRRNLEAEVALAREHGVIAVLVTMPFRADLFRSAVLPHDPDPEPTYGPLVDANNEAVRAVAAQHGALLVDAAPHLSTPEFLADDCHFHPAGEDALAARVTAALAEPLARRAASR